VHLKNAAYYPPAEAEAGDAGAGRVWRARWSPLEDGVVDFPALFAALAEVGYNNWLSFEDFSGARPSRAALRHNLAFIKGLLGA
jgi:sugar phosphate isomerase/epimerase